jgi:menaquinone-dependent protoporphyrinogen oxidase
MTTLNRRTVCRWLSLSPFSSLLAPVLNLQAAVAPLLNRRILVTYASQCGSTEEIARAILRDLEARGCSGDVTAVGKVKSVSGYDSILVGSAVHYWHWLPEAVDFVNRYRTELSRVPNGFFTVHFLNTGNDDDSKKKRLSYLDEVRGIVKPGVEVFFAGKLDTSKLGFFDRMGCRLMGMHDEDKRDWNAIHAFAGSVFVSQVQPGLIHSQNALAR